MSSAYGHFEELGLGLHWRGKAIAVLWAYFDESGAHGAGGILRRLTLGCAVAPFENWQALEPLWNDVLADAELPNGFHMADFEARVPPYDWDEPKRRDVLGRFLALASQYVPTFLGYNDLPRDLPSVKDLRGVYRSNLIKFLETVERERDYVFKNEDVTVVFAVHKNISAESIGRAFDRLQPTLGPKVHLGGFASPEQLPPLQVADLIAYEFSRTSREARPEQERYPLRYLASRAQHFTLYNGLMYQTQHGVRNGLAGGLGCD